MNVKKINYLLIIGVIIVLLLGVIVVFGDRIITYDPYGMQLQTFTMEGGELNVADIDVPPNRDHLFGTDIVGRDIFSQIIYGARYTLSLGVLIALFRLIIALPLSLIAGFGNRVVSKIIDFFDSFFSTIPTLIFCIIILNFNHIKSLRFDQSVVAFTIVLTFVGWSRLGKLLRERVKNILDLEFISGEVAIGKSNFLIAIQNVLPHLTVTIIIEIFFEIGRALVLLASLAVFKVYVGHTIYPYRLLGYRSDTFKATFDPEWGGLLGDSAYALTAKKSWIAIFPALAFFVSILGFNFLAEGLKIEVNKRNSRVISRLRKIPFHLSPKTFIYQIKNIKKYRKQVMFKTSIVLVILIPLFIPTPESLYKINAKSVFSQVEEFSKDKYEGRMLGTKGRDKACEYIVDSLKGYGLKPYFEEGYITTIESGDSIGDIEDNKLSILKDNGDIIDKLQFKKDYNYAFFDAYTKNYYRKLYSGKILTVDKLDKGEFDKTLEYFLLLEENSFNTIYHLYNYINTLNETVKLNGIIMPQNPMFKYPFKKKVTLMSVFTDSIKVNQNGLFNYKGDVENKPIILEATNNTLERLKKFEGQKMVFRNNIKIIDNVKYKHIAAMIKGKDSSKEKLIVTTNYDYLGYDGDIKYKGLLYNGTSISAVLEMADKFSSAKEKPERDIIFLFFDGSKHYSNVGSMAYFLKEGSGPLRDSFIVSMNSLGLKDSDYLFLDTSLGRTIKKKYFGYTQYIEKRAEELGLDLKREKLLYGSEDIFNMHSFGGKGFFFSSVALSSYNKLHSTPQNDMKIIDKGLLKDQIQLILDSIVYIAY